MQSIRVALMFRPYSWSSSRMHVGLVTFTSVRKSPITSSPANRMPCSRKRGPTVSTIWRSLSLKGHANAIAAGCQIAAIVARTGDAGEGIGDRLAVDHDDPLVAIADLRDEFCAMLNCAPCAVNVSIMTFLLGSPTRTRKIDAPPMPLSGLRITSWCVSMNALNSE